MVFSSLFPSGSSGKGTGDSPGHFFSRDEQANEQTIKNFLQQTEPENSLLEAAVASSPLGLCWLIPIPVINPILVIDPSRSSSPSWLSPSPSHHSSPSRCVHATHHPIPAVSLFLGLPILAGEGEEGGTQRGGKGAGCHLQLHGEGTGGCRSGGREGRLWVAGVAGQRMSCLPTPATQLPLASATLLVGEVWALLSLWEQCSFRLHPSLHIQETHGECACRCWDSPGPIPSSR